ncbi:PhzF family phenazine biosynthesis protein [Salinispora arenicola]|uniref:PhzF family phenazine biosynthesis protein n=1 Tax=Salinispora arenicola TaxID=168697 RepID=UPI0009B767F8|nr:PhzF family phenazine biosynthesis protein [Salinispora arenicola]
MAGPPWRRNVSPPTPSGPTARPFPPGGVVEDPATGAAAAALGGYLRCVSCPRRVCGRSRRGLLGRRGRRTW